MSNKQLKAFLTFCGILILAMCWTPMHGATLNRGYTFATNEQVTATKLHTLVDSGTVTNITAADFADATITGAKIANNTITSGNILDATITGTDLFPRTLTRDLIATNAITEIELNTNLTFRAGTLTFTAATLAFASDQVPASAVVGVTSSSGAGDSGKIAKLDGTGKFASGFIPSVGSSSVVTTNLAFATGSASGYTWKNIATINTTATSGSVMVLGSAAAVAGTEAASWIRVRDSVTNVVSVVKIGGNGITSSPVGNTMIIDSLSGSTKSYFMDVANSGGGSLVYTNIVASGGQEPGNTNCFYMKIIQNP